MGRAALGPVPALPPGTYTVTAAFATTVDLKPWAMPATTVTVTDPTYTGSSATGISMGVFYPFVGFFQ